MEILQIVALGLLALVALVLIRQTRPEVAVPIGIGVAAAFFLLILQPIGTVVRLISDLLDRAGVHTAYAGSLLRILGIAYLTEFGAQICRDAGEGALGAKLELAGKVFILLLAVPVVVAVVETLLGVLAF